MRVVALLVASSAAWATALIVADTPTRARTPGGEYICWREHLVDDERLSGGLRLRGGDGLQLADFDRDGYVDIVSVHEDSNHIRLAFGSADPDGWELVTLAEGDQAAAAEDASVADLNGDGYLDIIAACELAHLIYFQNPGNNIRRGNWPRVIPRITQGRGSFIRVFFADLDGDGRPEVTTANKGEQLPTVLPEAEIRHRHPRKAISVLAPPPDPLSECGWREHVLTRIELPENAQPVDLDGDGDLDIAGGSRWAARAFWFENLGGLRFHERPIDVRGRHVPWQRGAKRFSAFMADFCDLNGDGRLDIVINETPSDIVWLEQPGDFTQAWPIHRIGTIAPDHSAGITAADINGDGAVDVIVGGYSQNPRERDGESITPESHTGRIAWFENPGEAAGAWVRHDISRRKRGMFDAFVPYDLDGDGDLDFAATRGNSGNFDGVFWLEQVRTRQPGRSFQPARPAESAHLPLPAWERERRQDRVKPCSD